MVKVVSAENIFILNDNFGIFKYNVHAPYI